MNNFTIKEVAMLTGVKAHTLRIWEQRYPHFFTTKRKAQSNHRLYDNDDLKYLLRVAGLYQQGIKISGIAAMTNDEIIEAAMQSPGSDHNRYGLLINQLLEATIDFDQDAFEKVFSQSLLYSGFEQTILNLCYPFLKRIGLLWMTDNVIPAQEHFASNLVRKKIIKAIDALPAPRSGTYTLLFTPEGEFHEIPLLFNHYMLKKYGTPCIYLGSNVGVDVLETYYRAHPVKRLFVSLITNFTKLTPDEYCRSLLTRFPQTEVFIGGPFTRQLTISDERLFPIDSIADSISLAKKH